MSADSCRAQEPEGTAMPIRSPSLAREPRPSESGAGRHPCLDSRESGLLRGAGLHLGPAAVQHKLATINEPFRPRDAIGIDRLRSHPALPADTCTKINLRSAALPVGARPHENVTDEQGEILHHNHYFIDVQRNSDHDARFGKGAKLGLDRKTAGQEAGTDAVRARPYRQRLTSLRARTYGGQG